MIDKSKNSKALMIQGTSSYCGKSIFVAAFCKIFKDAGYRVAPFKAQNMSLNSYVTENGEEIARAQALQAFACGIEPTADMNPILLKPKEDMISQIVLHGKPYKDINAKDYYSEFALNEGIKSVKSSLSRLMANYDIIFIEGAGSPAEINLYEKDIANMKVAELANAPVLLVVDIDRGGAFASLVGTLEILKPKHKEIVKGFIINKFRGQSMLLEPGLKKLEQMTGKPVLGIVPYIQDLILPDEDSMSLERDFHYNDKATIAIIRLPRISNFTDFDPLELEGLINVRYVKSVEELGVPDAVIIPGTKNTIQDLLWLKDKGLAREIVRLAKLGIPILGICGGYQIIGKRIIDRKGIEGGRSGEFEGLGLLDVVTEFFEYDKLTRRVTAKIIANGPILNSSIRAKFSGYEIHMGKTSLGKDARPAFKIIKRGGKRVYDFDGAVDNTGLILGTYIHGIFDEPPVRRCLVDYLIRNKRTESRNKVIKDIREEWEKSLRKFANIVRNNLDMNRICEIIGIPPIK